MKGKVCTRSFSHVYNLSLMSALIDHLGDEKAQQWARGVKTNLAREPKGDDPPEPPLACCPRHNRRLAGQIVHVSPLINARPPGARAARPEGVRIARNRRGAPASAR